MPKYKPRLWKHKTFEEKLDAIQQDIGTLFGIVNELSDKDEEIVKNVKTLFSAMNKVGESLHEVRKKLKWRG